MRDDATLDATGPSGRGLYSTRLEQGRQACIRAHGRASGAVSGGDPPQGEAGSKTNDVLRASALNRRSAPAWAGYGSPPELEHSMWQELRLGRCLGRSVSNRNGQDCLMEARMVEWSVTWTGRSMPDGKPRRCKCGFGVCNCTRYCLRRDQLESEQSPDGCRRQDLPNAGAMDRALGLHLVPRGT